MFVERLIASLFLRVVSHSNFTKMTASDMSITQHLEVFLKHVDELRDTDENALDGYEKEFHVNI